MDEVLPILIGIVLNHSLWLPVNSGIFKTPWTGGISDFFLIHGISLFQERFVYLCSLVVNLGQVLAHIWPPYRKYVFLL